MSTQNSEDNEILNLSIPAADDELVSRTSNMTMSLRGRKRKTTYAEDYDYGEGTVCFFLIIIFF